MLNTQIEKLEVAEEELYYEVVGEGVPLVLGHAAFVDSRMFDGIMGMLAGEYRVIRYDMLGFGRSTAVHTPQCRRRTLGALLDHLGIEQAHFIGCSNSGQIMLDYLLERPERALSLTLVGSSPSGFEMQGAPPRYVLEMIEALQQGETERANELQIRIWLDGDQREPDALSLALREKALEMNAIPVGRNTFFLADGEPADPLEPAANGRLGEVSWPALVIVGGLDHAEVLRAGELLAAGIPGAELVVMTGTGHVPSYEQPEVFLQIWREFIG